jgi:hypothetical protein
MLFLLIEFLNALIGLAAGKVPGSAGQRFHER